jgi:hypothetical protein
MNIFAKRAAHTGDSCASRSQNTDNDAMKALQRGFA